ncbi:hypothetical protein EV646_105353 [Kribbella antiqua]|uniref:Uncharacterized protein n=1 Tax=Kribbella antiqua TaxID=2512217 RepID=A0A4R2ITL1_9ACTN|nr:hypothetical protein [Kribbella antiqua]TCO47796.1 hypothetical protein EV646_105353 [Kribbella antiqua]
MTADDYEYLASVFRRESADRPAALWRRRGDDMEYLSLVDWTWHPAGNVIPPHPDVLVPIGAEQVSALLADHQRFARYWVLREGPEEVRVYRQLSSPERLIEEVFGGDGEWIATHDIRDLQIGGPHDVRDLQPIDAATAEQLIQQTRGISGATQL